MNKTFYIATGSTDPIQRLHVQQLANKLFHRFGWTNKFDWTDGFQDENKYPKHELIYRALTDLESARDCDVFIFLETEDRSLGANREWGARWAAGRKIYRVSKFPEHLFDMLDVVISVETDEELIDLLYVREVR